MRILRNFVSLINKNDCMNALGSSELRFQNSLKIHTIFWNYDNKLKSLCEVCLLKSVYGSFNMKI